MLALGRAIISDPKLLIIDEMSLGLHHSVQPPLFEAVRAGSSTGTAVLLVDESTGSPWMPPTTATSWPPGR